MCWEGWVTYLSGEFGKELSPMALPFWALPLGGLPACTEGTLGPTTENGACSQLAVSVLGWESLADSGGM